MSQPPKSDEIITHARMPNGELVELGEIVPYARRPVPSYTSFDPGWKPLKEAPCEQHVPDE